MEGELSGHHWDALRRLLPVYQAITSVSLGDGATTSFWFDVWHDKGCFADRFPALFTHCMVKTQLVRHVVQNGIRDSLVPRLSASAREELHALEAIVTGTTLRRPPPQPVHPAKREASDLSRLQAARTTTRRRHHPQVHLRQHRATQSPILRLAGDPRPHPEQVQLGGEENRRRCRM